MSSEAAAVCCAYDVLGYCLSKALSRTPYRLDDNNPLLCKNHVHPHDHSGTGLCLTTSLGVLENILHDRIPHEIRTAEERLPIEHSEYMASNSLKMQYLTTTATSLKTDLVEANNRGEYEEGYTLLLQLQFIASEIDVLKELMRDISNRKVCGVCGEVFFSSVATSPLHVGSAHHDNVNALFEARDVLLRKTATM
eukprot:PhF_6_TR11364/c0_g1_i2/m.18328